jgi:DNA modification methylase
MSKAKQSGGGSGELPIETDFRLKQERTFEPKKNVPVERAEIAFIEPPGPDEVEIPEQKQHFDLPVRFGAVPVDKAPLGWEVETRRPEFKVTKFQHAYPTIRLPFQEVQRVEFGHSKEFLAANEKDPKLRELFPTGANRLFFGDNLHIMRQLPSNSIDLFYIDPPFFSGRNYNVIFGDKNEVRSFSDIWEGGMPGYLVWLNARLYEMKRLLKPTGSIYVHLDWHASHYVKVEMDKIFGVENFHNEIIWHYRRWTGSSREFLKMHDVLLFYSKSADYFFEPQFTEYTLESTFRKQNYHTRIKGGDVFVTSVDERGVKENDFWKIPSLRECADIAGRLSAAGVNDKEITEILVKYLKHFLTQSRTNIPLKTAKEIQNLLKMMESHGSDCFFVSVINSQASERIGYPTQKPEELLEKIITASTPNPENTQDPIVVADFFCGGGTTPSVAQRLNRRWIACDQSRIAVAVTADRIGKVIEEKVGNLFPVPDFTIEHWGIYEAPKLEKFKTAEFREFVVRAFGGRPESVTPTIHGVRYGVPLYVGESSRSSRIGKEDVAKFAKAVYEERRANHGVILAWNFGPEARKAAEILAARENKRIDFVRLNLVRLESDEFREHVINRHKDYAPLLSFIQPPQVRVAVRRAKSLTYQFDVSESVSLNKDGVIANVQWDFDHKHGRFTSTQGYAYLRDKATGKPVLVVEYEFSRAGSFIIACSVQDDQGGERTVVQTIEVN